MDAVSLREWIAKHSDHLDQGIHEVQQQLTAVAAELSVMRGQLAEVHAELEAAKPMIEKWQHSKIRKLVTGGGQPPWMQPHD
jgi:phage shock protein A